ncbi:M20/M25/M40 family metallo-hydrolase [Pontiellaceae bacterium B1224]|nr:M20/M25/M40 family metallo-hydrolase [Pontiellaceae bacterium B1224]
MTSPKINSVRMLELFRGMVDIYSPSGKEEELAGYLEAFLDEQRLSYIRQFVDESRYNLIISRSRSADTLFLGHYDTVPAFDIEQFSFSMKGNICAGLGTADMKGGCAAMIEAFVSASEAEILPDNAALALVVGEEETGDGTQALLKEYTYEQAVVGEPTELKPCLNHYGYVEMILRSFGYRRHAAMSGHETNAIRSMLRFLLQLEDHVNEIDHKVVLNMRDLHSSEAGFAVPDRCAASVDLHIPPKIQAKAFADALQDFVEKQVIECGASNYELDFPTLADGYSIDEGHPFALQLMKVYRARSIPWEAAPFNSHSDANLLRDAGCCPVVLGPGQLAKAHTRDESIDFQQVEGAAGIYLDLLQSMHEAEG